MNKILRFLYNHIGFLFFLILEILAFLLLINKNELQKSVAFRVGTNVAAYSYEFTSAMTKYFGLAKVNERLASENAELRSKLTLLEERVAMVDTVNFECDEIIDFIPAKVVYNSIYDIQNFIIVDKGSSCGIEPDMGVISSQGVVGVVQRVSKNFSVILPLINPEQVVSAKLKGSNQLGSVTWDGFSPRRTKLKEIPSHVNPVAGDSVVTSGFSAIFPEGMFIGTIDKAVHQQHAMFCDVDVDLAVDFQSLTYVTITAFKNKNELSNLQDEIVNEK